MEVIMILQRMQRLISGKKNSRSDTYQGDTWCATAHTPQG